MADEMPAPTRSAFPLSATSPSTGVEVAKTSKEQGTLPTDNKDPGAAVESRGRYLFRPLGRKRGWVETDNEKPSVHSKSRRVNLSL